MRKGEFRDFLVKVVEEDFEREVSLEDKKRVYLRSSGQYGNLADFLAEREPARYREIIDEYKGAAVELEQRADKILVADDRKREDISY